MSAFFRLRALALAALVSCTLMPGLAFAQQNLFNVPSSSVTPRGGVFVQEQVNVMRTVATSSTTVDVGLGHGIDLGFDVFDVAFAGPHNRDLPLFVLGNAQSVFDPIPALRLTVGTQQGVSTMHGGTQWAGFGWASLRYSVREGRYGRYLLGTYVCTRGYGGAGNRVGGLAGFELPLAGDHLTVMADFVIGRNDIGVAVIGLQIGLGHEAHTQLSLGAQLPSPGSHNAYGGVLELTFVPHGNAQRAAPPMITPLTSARHPHEAHHT